MSTDLSCDRDPRWGHAERDQKGQAILSTLRIHCGPEVSRGLWVDVGCGSGGIAAALAPRVDRVIGLDPEPWGRWQEFESRHSNLQFKVGGYKAADMLIGAGLCDVVICNQVYEHVEDPIALVQAIHRLMKPSGVCYFAGPNLLWPIEPHVFWPFVHWLPRKYARWMMTALGSKRANELDASSWNYWKLTRVFRESGFKVFSAIRERAMVQLEFGPPRWVIQHLPKWTIGTVAPFAPGFVFILRL